jgi:hypothetical protein
MDFAEHPDQADMREGIGACAEHREPGFTR